MRGRVPVSRFDAQCVKPSGGHLHVRNAQPSKVQCVGGCDAAAFLHHLADARPAFSESPPARGGPCVGRKMSLISFTNLFKCVCTTTLAFPIQSYPDFPGDLIPKFDETGSWKKRMFSADRYQ